MTDHVRAELARRRREAIVVMEAPAHEQVAPAPDRASTTPHAGRHARPALHVLSSRRSRRPSAIALTLRAVGGLTTAEIANAFLVPEATMAQRISRAKQTHQDVRRAVPHARPRRERAERLSAVLHVLYLIFNEGYASSIGPEPAAPRPRRARRSG